MGEFVRVAALSGYFEVMADLGVDPRTLLREQGFSAAMLVDPEQLISGRAAARLLERSAEATGCVTLGLRMAEGRELANLGATSLLIAHQATLRQALAALTEFRSRINSTLVLQVEEHDGHAIVREDFAFRRPEATRQSSNLALGVLLRLCKAVMGETWAPEGVCFTHQPPPVSELPIFFRIFGCRPEFDREFNGIIIAASDLDSSNPRADNQLAFHARQLIAAAQRPESRTVAEDVDQLITVLLPSGRASIQTCAASLGMTVRTLQRMLEAEEETFSDLLQRVRMRLANQYLTNPRMRITDVAQLLGYGSIGAYTRWHSQVFGKPPLAWRKAASPLRSPR